MVWKVHGFWRYNCLRAVEPGALGDEEEPAFARAVARVEMSYQGIFEGPVTFETRRRDLQIRAFRSTTASANGDFYDGEFTFKLNRPSTASSSEDAVARYAPARLGLAPREEEDDAGGADDGGSHEVMVRGPVFYRCERYSVPTAEPGSAEAGGARQTWGGSVVEDMWSYNRG